MPQGQTVAAAASSASSEAAVGIGPVLGAGSTFRLDKQSFWRNLGGGWQEISGPSDPLLISGLYAMSPDEPNTVLLHLKVLNRWASTGAGAGWGAAAVLVVVCCLQAPGAQPASCTCCGVPPMPPGHPGLTRLLPLPSRLQA
jgi:hypothetical protein